MSPGVAERHGPLRRSAVLRPFLFPILPSTMTLPLRIPFLRVPARPRIPHPLMTITSRLLGLSSCRHAAVLALQKPSR